MAVGSSLGHAIGGMFAGSSAPVEQQQADNAVASQANENNSQNNAWGVRSCETDAKSFTKCLDQNQGNMQICGWYLDQLVIAKRDIVLGLDVTLTYCTEGLPASGQSVLDKADLAIATRSGKHARNEHSHNRWKSKPPSTAFKQWVSFSRGFSSGSVFVSIREPLPLLSANRNS